MCFSDLSRQFAAAPSGLTHAMLPRVISALLVLLALSEARDATPEKDRVARIIGGEGIDSMNEWPWLVSITASVGRYTYYCGASVISDEWLLTAAHCFDSNRNPKYWTARMASIKRWATGGDKIRDFFGKMFNRKDWQQYEYGFSDIVVHEEYNKNKNWVNDIALVKVNGRIPVSPDVVPEVQQIQLPREGDKSFPTAGQKCVMKGWGCTEKGGHVSYYAQATVLPIVKESTCARSYRADFTTRLCAGYLNKGKGICPGDSGGPLVCQRGNDWVQVGIASFTSRHKPGNFYGAFTRVSHYKNWIVKTMKSRR